MKPDALTASATPAVHGKVRLLTGLLTVVLVATSCVSATPDGQGDTRPAAPTIPANFTLLPPADFSELGRVEAFEKLHERVRTNYALTDWKGIDFEALRTAFLPLVRRADEHDSATDYLIALQRYAAAFDDAHVRVSESGASDVTARGPISTELITQQSGGTVGLAIVRLDDDRVVTVAVPDRGPAAAAGIEPGAEVLRWNGTPTAQAVRAVDLGGLAAATPVATDEFRALEQARLLPRMPVGATVRIEARNPDGRVIQTVLTAIGDGGAGLHDGDLAAPLPSKLEHDAMPQVRTLQGGIGYIRLGWLVNPSDLDAYPDDIAEAFNSALTTLAGAPGLIIDLRANHGGSDQLAADLCGAFVARPTFYERTQFFDSTTRSWATLTLDGRTGEPIDALVTLPRKPQYTGPVAVLVNPRTISSGEGLARCIGSTARATVIGLYGTRGSFAIASGDVPMPDALVFHYPNGRSIDAEGVIQIDSRGGVGGVTPTRRIAMTSDHAMAFGRGTDIELDAALDWVNSQR
jgi:carboxyl-terminal processing protease